ncbi:MAG: hypothetical protein GY778_31520, partial [bacterium]|nr:hypothetical protein [bacterium]
MSPGPQPTAVPLTSYPGEEVYPTFSPDGTEVAYSWNDPSLGNYDIYRQPVGPGETPLRLTTDGARDHSPAWSPDGRRIAFVRAAEDVGKASLLLIPSLGGPERVVAKIDARGLGPVHPPSQKLSWSVDGHWLVVPDTDQEIEYSGLDPNSIE